MGADGVTTTTSTGTRGSGTVPASSQAASAAIADGALTADLSKGPLAIPTDANTLLTAAHALYQQAKVLDNQISKAVVPKGYRAHLLTLQVNLQPRRRDYAYDAYLNVSLMPGTWKESLSTSKHFDTDEADMPAVVFYPLIISDALETANVGRSVEIVRQLALSLSGVVGRVGLNAGTNSGTDSLDQLMGTDKNSLITLGRVNDSTLRVRIGAQHAGSSKYAMVPRTYNVSLVVLTRNKNAEDRVKTLSIVTRTDFVSSTTGKVLEPGSERRRDELAHDVYSVVVKSYGQKIAPTCGLGPAPTSQGRTNRKITVGEDTFEMEPALDLLRALGRGDYQEVARCLGKDSGVETRTEPMLRRMVADLLNVQTTSRHSTLQVALGAIEESILPPASQFVIVKDDKSSLSGILRGGEGLIGSEVSALLKLKATSSEQVLLPSSVSVSGGRDISVAFPSLTSIGMEPKDLEDAPLELSLKSGGSKSYRIKFIAGEKPPTSNPVRADSAIIVSDAAGNGRLTLSVNKLSDGTKGKLRVSVSGADLREDKSISAVVPTNQGINLAPESVVTLSLGNLSPARPVVVSTFVNNRKLGELTLPVERSASQK